MVVTDVSDINNKNIDFKSKYIGEPLLILVQDKGRWSKDSSLHLHPPAVPWVERIKIILKNNIEKYSLRIGMLNRLLKEELISEKEHSTIRNSIKRKYEIKE